MKHSIARPEFWDNLSRIPLCERALKELDRRNRIWKQAACIVRTATPSQKLKDIIPNVEELRRVAKDGGQTFAMLE